MNKDGRHHCKSEADTGRHHCKSEVARAAGQTRAGVEQDGEEVRCYQPCPALEIESRRDM